MAKRLRPGSVRNGGEHGLDSRAPHPRIMRSRECRGRWQRPSANRRPSARRVASVIPTDAPFTSAAWGSRSAPTVAKRSIEEDGCACLFEEVGHQCCRPLTARERKIVALRRLFRVANENDFGRLSKGGRRGFGALSTGDSSNHQVQNQRCGDRNRADITAARTR